MKRRIKEENKWKIFLVSILFKSRSFPAHLEHWLSIGTLDITHECSSVWLNSSPSTPSHLTPRLGFLSLLKEPYLPISTFRNFKLFFILSSLLLSYSQEPYPIQSTFSLFKKKKKSVPVLSLLSLLL